MTDDAARARLGGEVLRFAGSRTSPRDRGRRDHPGRLDRRRQVAARRGPRRRGAACLALRLAERTIRAAVATPGVDEVLVITPDDEVRDLALPVGARPMRQRSRGLNDGLREARDEAIAAGADAVLVLPDRHPRDRPGPPGAAGGDGAGRVGHRSSPSSPIVMIAAPMRSSCDRPTSSTSGSAATAWRPTSTAGRTAGAQVELLDGPLTLDIDTPEDLLLAQAEAPEAVGG